MALDGTMNIVRVAHVRWTTAAHYTNLSGITNITGFACSIVAKLSGSQFYVSIHHSGLLFCDGDLGLKRNGTQCVQNLIGTDRSYSHNYHDVDTFAGNFLDTGISSTA